MHVDFSWSIVPRLSLFLVNLMQGEIGMCVRSNGIPDTITTCLSLRIRMLILSRMVCSVLRWIYRPLLLKRTAPALAQVMQRERNHSNISSESRIPDAAVHQDAEPAFQSPESLFRYSAGANEAVVE
eukprot:scpid86654/ scgid11687/ 